MPRFLRLILGTLLLFATIGLVTCQSLLQASPLHSEITSVNSINPVKY